MSWDPFQREILAELGHVVYRRAGVAVTAEAQQIRVDASPCETESIDGPMLTCIARAASMTIEALQARFEDIHVIASLRGNPDAKRALWPRLRAMRRQQG